MNSFPNRSCNPSPTLAINEKVQQRWELGGSVYHLGFGESRMPLHPSLAAALIQHAHQKSYLPALGLWQLRQAVADFYQRNWQINAEPDRVVIGPGSKALIFAIQLALKSQLLLPTPSWVSYGPQARLIGNEVVYVAAAAADNFQLTIEALQQAIGSSVQAKARLLIINSPNNPTGNVLSVSFLKALAEFCRANRIIVVSDEIYALTTYGQKEHVSIASYYPEATIVLGGPSKHLSVGGWRIGTAILPDSPLGYSLLNPLQTIASEIWSSPSAPIQYAAMTAYSDDDHLQQYVRHCTALHELKTRKLWQSLSDLGIVCTEPQGGFYFVANFDSWQDQFAAIGVTSSDELVNHLLEEFDIAVLAGSAFGIPDDELSIRIATSYLDMETDANAENLMSKFLDNDSRLGKSDLPRTDAAISQFARCIEGLQRQSNVA